MDVDKGFKQSIASKMSRTKRETRQRSEVVTGHMSRGGGGFGKRRISLAPVQERRRPDARRAGPGC